jgi:cysteine desulfurase
VVVGSRSAPEAAPAVYLDHLATTPVDPRVLEAMLPYFTEHIGNPNSKTHAYGWAAADAVDRARQQVAALIGAQAREVVFTSGATEANSLAIRGVLDAVQRPDAHVVTCVTEHPAVLECLEALEARGLAVDRVEVGRDGRLDPQRLEAALTERTVLISVMAANNEIGAIHPLEEIGAIARRHQILWHCDAAQAVGKIPIDVERLGVDLLSLSGHKIYGPKGVGALYVRRRGRRVRLSPQLVGGGQERGLRAGTLNVPGIVGLGAACDVFAADGEGEAQKIQGLRRRIKQQIMAGVDDVAVNGGEGGLPGCLSLSFTGIDSGVLLQALPDIALSAGSACASGTGAPSHVLKAIGLSDAAAVGSVRIGIGRFNSPDEIDRAGLRLVEEVGRLRRLL